MECDEIKLSCAFNIGTASQYARGGPCRTKQWPHSGKTHWVPHHHVHFLQKLHESLCISTMGPEQMSDYCNTDIDLPFYSFGAGNITLMFFSHSSHSRRATSECRAERGSNTAGNSSGAFKVYVDHPVHQHMTAVNDNRKIDKYAHRHRMRYQQHCTRMLDPSWGRRTLTF